MKKQRATVDIFWENVERSGLIYELARNSMAAEYIITAHDQLTRLEQLKVLAAFAEWGMKNDK